MSVPTANIPKIYVAQKRLDHLYAVVTFDSSGNPTLQQVVPSTGAAPLTYTPAVTSPVNTLSGTGFQGIASVAKTANVGEYLFTIDGSAQRVLDVSALWVGSSPTVPLAFLPLTPQLVDAANYLTAGAFLGPSNNVVDVLLVSNATGSVAATAPISCTGIFKFTLDESSSI